MCIQTASWIHFHEILIEFEWATVPKNGVNTLPSSYLSQGGGRPLFTQWTSITTKKLHTPGKAMVGCVCRRLKQISSVVIFIAVVTPFSSDQSANYKQIWCDDNSPSHIWRTNCSKCIKSLLTVLVNGNTLPSSEQWTGRVFAEIRISTEAKGISVSFIFQTKTFLHFW